MPLPTFKYHPDPVATGSVQTSDRQCVCCHQRRGYIYVGPVYSADEIEEQICPWCIADGSAANKYDASFTDGAGIGACGDGQAVPDHVSEEVTRRTPGFSGWQQEQWFTHCGDAAVFLGAAGYEELQQLGKNAIEAIQESTGLLPGPEWENFFTALDKDGSPRAYIFRCATCGVLGGYQDCD